MFFKSQLQSVCSYEYVDILNWVFPLRTVGFYRPQRNCGKVIFSQMCVKNSVQGVCMAGGACMVGGVHGRGHAWQGACVSGGHAWGGMHGRGCAWQGGMHGRGACVAGGHAWQGACLAGGHAWQRGACMAGGMHGLGHAWQRGVHGRKNGNCSRQYASYWNAFLLIHACCESKKVFPRDIYLCRQRTYKAAFFSHRINSTMCHR